MVGPARSERPGFLLGDWRYPRRISLRSARKFLYPVVKSQGVGGVGVRRIPTEFAARYFCSQAWRSRGYLPNRNTPVGQAGRLSDRRDARPTGGMANFLRAAATRIRYQPMSVFDGLFFCGLQVSEHGIGIGVFKGIVWGII